MGGCTSTPQALDSPKPNVVPAEKLAESEAPKTPVKGDVEGDASVQKGEAEIATESENKEEPLVDLSSPKPEAQKSEVVELAPEMSELVIEAPKEDVAIAEQVAEAENKEEVVEEKVEEVKETEEKVSA